MRRCRVLRAGWAGPGAHLVLEAELAFDLDTPDDILTVLRSSRPTRTRAVLRELGADERVNARASGI